MAYPVPYALKSTRDPSRFDPRVRPVRFTLDTHHPLATGLVFAGLGGNGVRLHDYSEYENHGTLVNMEDSDWSFDAMLGRWCLNLDGTNEGTTHLTTTALDGKLLTLSAWIWWNDADTDYPRIFDRTYNGQFALYVTEVNRQLGMAVNTTGGSTDATDISAGNTIPASNTAWVHVVGVYDGYDLLSYIDGEYNSSKPAADGVLATSTSAWSIGQRTEAGSLRAFKGKISDPLIYDRVLSAEEIARLADPENVLLDDLLIPEEPDRSISERRIAVVRGHSFEKPVIRPQQFELNYDHSLAKGLYIAALGNSPTALRVIDSSKQQNNSTGGTYRPNFWTFDSYLRRMSMRLDADYSTYVTFPYYTGTPSAFCCAFWLNSVFGTRQAFGNNNLTTDRNGFCAYPSSTTIYFENSSASANYYRSAPHTDNVWEHYVCNFSNSNMYIYRNGIRADNGGNAQGTIISPVMGTYPFTMGKDPASVNYNMKGYMADVMFWFDRNLTEKEITILSDRSETLLSDFIVPQQGTTEYFRGVTLSDTYTLKPPTVHVSNGVSRPQNFTLDYDHPLASGLVFAGLGNAPGSTRYNDSSKYGSHGTINTNKITWGYNTSPHLNCVAAGYTLPHGVRCTGRLLTNSAASFSIVSTITPYTANYCVFGLGNYVTGAIWLYITGSKFDFYTFNAGVYADNRYSDSTIITGTKYTVVTQIRGITKEMYVNGVRQADYVDNKPPSALVGVFDVGNEDAAGGYKPFDGLIHKTMVYNRSLNQSEIDQVSDDDNILLSNLIKPISGPLPITINDRHWVGRSSDWHDVDNWSRSQGGQGGAGVPNENTNVFFD